MLDWKFLFIPLLVMVFSIPLASYLEKRNQNNSKNLCLIASLCVGIYYILAGLYLAIDWTNSKIWNDINDGIRFETGTILPASDGGIMIYLFFPYVLIIIGGFIAYLSFKVICGKGKVSNKD